MLRLLSILYLSLALAPHCPGQDIPLQPSREETPPSGINYMTFSPDGSLFATCTNNRQIQLWEPATCKRKLVLSSPNDDRNLDLRGVDISPDGKLAASLQCGPRNDRTILLWDLEKGTFQKSAGAAKHQGTNVLSDFEFSPDGKMIWTSEGPIMSRWDLSTSAVRQHQVERMLHGRLRFINDTDALAVYGMAWLFVADPGTGQQYFRFGDERIHWGDILGDGERFVVQTQRGELLVGSVKSGEVERRFRPRSGNPGWAKLLYGKDQLLVFTTTGHIERWDLTEGRCTGRLAKPVAIARYQMNETIRFGQPNRGAFLIYHPTPLAISPDNSLVAVHAGRQFAMLPLDWQEP